MASLGRSVAKICWRNLCVIPSKAGAPSSLELVITLLEIICCILLTNTSKAGMGETEVNLIFMRPYWMGQKITTNRGRYDRTCDCSTTVLGVLILLIVLNRCCRERSLLVGQKKTNRGP
jgi:hypothetical protein